VIYLMLAISFAGLLFSLLMGVRNYWVAGTMGKWLQQIREIKSLEERLKILSEFKVDPMYNRMMLRWWNWDTRMEAWKQ
jgi:hypothetical protein